MTRSPSCTRLKTVLPDVSISTMPASSRMPGPRFGYRPDTDGTALTTAATAGQHQRFGADPVQVDVVDDGDLARPQPLGEILRPSVEPHHAADLSGSGVSP